MARRANRTERRLADELPRLIEERGLSVRGLALAAHITPPHLWRILRRQPGGNPSLQTALAITEALGLPEDYFPEVREGRVIEAVKNDPQLRDRVYRQISKR